MAISVSIGLATFPRDGLTPESILLAADRACFVAKRTGPGLIATADEGLARAKEFSLQEPTPDRSVKVSSSADVDDAGRVADAASTRASAPIQLVSRLGPHDRRVRRAVRRSPVLCLCLAFARRRVPAGHGRATR